MKNMIVVVALCLSPSMLFSQSKQADTTPAAKTKEPDRTVYGLHLGEKFSLPECTRMTNKSGKEVGLYDLETAVMCYQLEFGEVPKGVKANTPVVTHWVYINYPYGIGVAHIRGDMVGYVIDGSLERVNIPTSGLGDQNYWLAQLKEKYGEPVAFKTVDKENALGAVFSVVAASWRFADLEVDFDGGDLNEGSINIMTNKGHDWSEPRIPAGPKL